jgi:hypothetical protein
MFVLSCSRFNKGCLRTFFKITELYDFTIYLDGYEYFLRRLSTDPSHVFLAENLGPENIIRLDGTVRKTT